MKDGHHNHNRQSAGFYRTIFAPLAEFTILMMSAGSFEKAKMFRMRPE